MGYVFGIALYGGEAILATYIIAGVVLAVAHLVQYPASDVYVCGLFFAIGYQILRGVLNAKLSPSYVATYFDQWPEGVLTNAIVCVIGVAWCVWDGKRARRSGARPNVIASRAGIVLSCLPLICGVFFPVM